MEKMWLGFGKEELSIEWQQLADEGAALTDSMETEANNLLSYEGKETEEYQARVRILMEQSAHLPCKEDYPYQEPSDLNEINRAKPVDPIPLPQVTLSDNALLDRIHGAWLGRCSGCLLGKPIEGLLTRDTWVELKRINQFPLHSYLDSSFRKALENKCAFPFQTGWIDQIDHMIEDDDTNYTVLSLAVMSEFGWGFKPEDIATAWLKRLPAYHTFTAERVAYRNFLLLKSPPQSASYCNPYREWIGAQIRGDFWGYICPGKPEIAARLAWRDACVSHIKNGIYGEMWSAAMVSAAAILDTPYQILNAGLAQIPERSRLTANINEMIDCYDSGMGVNEALRCIHQRWDETNMYHWCHVLSNAQIVALALLWGGGDFEKSIGWAVTAGFDTDCNGATVGSILGMQLGAEKLPRKWTDPINNRLDTGIKGSEQVYISDLARRTIDLLRQNPETYPQT